MSAQRFSRDFHNIEFKIQHKLYVTSWSAPMQEKILDAPILSMEINLSKTNLHNFSF